MIDKGLHPLSISDGYDKACKIAVGRLNEIKEDLDIFENDNEALVKAAMISLGSKIVNKCRRKIARLCVDAVLMVADMERKDVNFEYIKVEAKTGSCIEDTILVEGIIIDKEISHP